MSGRALQDAPPAFVARDERELLFLGLADVVARCGRHDVSPEEVAAAAGLPVRAFRRRFETVEQCMLEAYDAAVEQAFGAAASAYVRAPGGWAEAVHAALAELLDFLAGSPALTRMCTVEALYAGSPALEARDRALERFDDFVQPGYALAERTPPPVAAEAVTGGVLELIRAHAAEERIDALPEALPAATVIVLTPFVGSEHAERVAARPAPGRA